MTSMQQWTPDQWAVFAVTIAAGVAAAVLLWRVRSAVLGWTVPAPMRYAEHISPPRPSLVLAQRRAVIPNGLTDADHRFNERSAGQLELVRAWARADALPPIEPSRQVPVIAGELPAWTDPTIADFTDPGIGALSSIQAVDADPALVTSAELHAELDAWINAYADLAPLMPETAAAAERMRVALEPARRTIEVWRMRGEGGPARRALNDWRIGTETGEYRTILTTSDLAPYASALLAS